MREHYTFSRTLHLMRYGGDKMRHVSFAEGVYLWYDRVAHCLMLHFPSGSDVIAQLDGFELGGSFTRYVQELDGVK